MTRQVWLAERPHNDLPFLPPAHSVIETRAVLKSCRRRPKGRRFQRQTASVYLKQLAEVGVLTELDAGKEKLFIHPKLMKLLSRDANDFEKYAM